MASDKTPLIEFLKVEQGWEKNAVSSFTQAAKDIDVEIMKLKPKTNVSSRLRLEQLNASKKAINEKLSSLYEDLGDSITAAQYKAAAAAVPVSNSEAIAFIEKHGANTDLLVESLTEKAQNRLKAAMTRVQGKSYVPLSKSVYKNEALTKGVVDNIVNSGIANGLSAREIADRVKGYIDPSVPGGASYAAMRLGRTEINNAYHATQVEEHINSPWVGEIEWNTSGSHKNEDTCDEYAAMSPWWKTEVPRKPHPQCFCYITPVAMAEDDFLDTLFAEKEGKTVDNEMFAGNEALERWLQETKEVIKPPKLLPPVFNSYTTAMDWLKSQKTYDGLSSKGKLSSMLAAHQKGNSSSLQKHASEAKGDVKQAFENITGAKLAGQPQSDLPTPLKTPEKPKTAPLAKPKAANLKDFESASDWVKQQPQFFDVDYNSKANLASALVAHKKGFLASAGKYTKDLPESMKKAFEDITGTSVSSLPVVKKIAPKKVAPAKKTTPKKTTPKVAPAPKPDVPTTPPPPLTPMEKKWKGKDAPVKPTVDPSLKLPTDYDVPLPPGFTKTLPGLVKDGDPMSSVAKTLPAQFEHVGQVKAWLKMLETTGIVDKVDLDETLARLAVVEKNAPKADSKLVAAVKAQDEALARWQKDFDEWESVNGSTASGMDATQRWTSERDALDWANGNLPVAATDSPQWKAVREYTGSLYEQWNTALRSMPDRRGTPEGRWKGRTKSADEAMKPLPKSIIVHRGSGADAFVVNGRRLGKYSESELQQLVGTVQVDQAYMSTSIGTRSAFSSKPVQVKIRVPEGHGAAWARPYSRYPTENELILQRGSRLFIHDVYESGGRWLVEAEVIPEGVTEEAFAAMGRRPAKKRFKVDDYER